MAAILGAGLALAGPSPAASYSDEDLAAVLVGFVNEEGLVDYASLKEQRNILDAYIVEIQTLDPKVYDKWNEKEKIAFWINSYNAITLKLVVDHYPIKPNPPHPGSPPNSIKQIPGVWNEQKMMMVGRKVTLDHIEHSILRGEFHEPRIHMALVCGAISCPKLRREPYRGATLDRQLDEQVRDYLADLRQFQIDREHNVVWASEVFKWFTDDFLPGVSEKNERPIAERKALTAFTSKYLNEADRAFLEGTTYKLRFFTYNWALNEQVN
jgi:hypothetical protein